MSTRCIIGDELVSGDVRLHAMRVHSNWLDVSVSKIQRVAV
jgi:hypothetical protein